MELTALPTPAEEGSFFALNPETGTTTQGQLKPIEEDVASLQEATALFLVEGVQPDDRADAQEAPPFAGRSSPPYELTRSGRSLQAVLSV